MALVDIILNPEQTEGTQATVNRWLYAVGDIVEKNQPVLELETDKVMLEIIAPVSGKLNKILLNAGDEVVDSSILGIIDSDVRIEKNKTDSTANGKKTISTPTAVTADRTISPTVRRLCKQYGINPAQVQGTGKNNRVTSRDIQGFLQHNKITNTSSQHLPISNMRKHIAKHMVQSLLHTAPHVTSVFNLDLSAIIAHRKLYKQKFAAKNTNLTFTAYFIAASATAIKQVPLINSQLHATSIEIFKHINIGIGTDLADDGLIVPVVKHCENKDLFAIAENLTALTNKARKHKLKPDDVKGGTFTISNHGVSGSLIATPIIINQPQSAILGIGKMEKRVVVQEINGADALLIKPMCYITLTIDHRTLDAHHCNQFLRIFIETLENWQ